MISDTTKLELLKKAQHILNDLPNSIKGNQSLVQELCNRIEVIAKNPEEYRYLVDAVTVMIEKAKGQEIKVFKNGKELSREDLAIQFGIFLKPKNKNIFGNGAAD